MANVPFPQEKIWTLLQNQIQFVYTSNNRNFSDFDVISATFSFCGFDASAAKYDTFLKVWQNPETSFITF